VWPTGKGSWRFDCSCGYRMQATTRSRLLAGGAAIHHLRKEIARARADGVNVRDWLQRMELRNVPEDVQRLNPFPWIGKDGATVEPVEDVTTPLLGRTV